MFCKPRENPNATSFSSIVGKARARILRYLTASTFTKISESLFINKLIIDSPNTKISNANGIPIKTDIKNPLKKIVFNSWLFLISLSFISVVFCSFPNEELTIAVVAVHNGYAAAASTLNKAPLTDSDARLFVASNGLINLPTQQVSTNVKTGSAIHAANDGTAIDSIDLYNLFLSFLSIDTVEDVDDVDDDSEDDDLDDLDNGDIGDLDDVGDLSSNVEDRDDNNDLDDDNNDNNNIITII